jgi:hypothetical protein
MSLNASGGNYQCPHGINTDDVNEWNEHCSDPANNHRDTGTTQCVDCNSTVVFDIPFRKIKADGSKSILLQCPECKENQSDNSAQIMKIDNPSDGYRMVEPHEKQQKESQQ